MRRNKEVEAWFGRYENPLKDVVLRMRDIVLGADRRVGECIKWQAPTFTYRGNLATFFPKSKRHASLMFHTGAVIPGKHPILVGGGDSSRVVKIGSLGEAESAKRDLERLVVAWCDHRDAEEAGVTKKKPLAAKLVSKATKATKTTKITKITKTTKPSKTAATKRRAR